MNTAASEWSGYIARINAVEVAKATSANAQQGKEGK